MNKRANKVLAVVLPVVIIAAIVVAVKRSHVRSDPGGWFAYEAFAIDETGKVYVFKFNGPGLAWPALYRGHSLAPLYGCSDCKAVFAGNARGVTAVCPDCHGYNVGMYDPKVHGEIEAERISPKELQLPGT